MFGKSRKSGVMFPPELDAQKNLYARICGGPLAEAALAGRLFCVANQAKVAVTAGLATTWTGLGIANPSGSGKIFIVHEFSWGSDIVNPAEGVVGLMTATDTGFAAAIAARCTRFAKGVSRAYCDDGATISTPVLERICGSTMEGAISTVPDCAPKIIDLKGSIILDPGRSVLTYHSIGGTASLIFGFVWEEIDEDDV